MMDRPARDRRSGALAVVLLGLALVVVDLALRAGLPSNANLRTWTTKDALIYANGVVFSVGAWTLLALVLARLGRARLWVTGLVAVIAGAVALTSFGYRMQAFQSPSWQLVRFLVVEPRNAAGLTAGELRAGHALGFLGLAGGMFAALAFASARGVALPGRKVGRAVVGVVVAASGAVAMFVPGAQHPLPFETNAAAALAQLALAWSTGERHLVAPMRPALPPQPTRARPSVLLVVHESLRADAQIPDLGYEGKLDARALSPWSARLVGRRADGFVVLPRARSNSTATESSLPTILSGIDLGGDPDAYGRAQSVWSLGKASGAQTFLFSAQTYHWSHFDEYFFDKNLDVQRTGADLGPIVNDVGCDDALAVEATIEHATRLHAAGQRFVGVVHFNATHRPGYPGPGVAPVADPFLRYQQAVTYVDVLVARLWSGLEAGGVLDDTVVLSTSDHGEPYESPHRVERLGSYYEETVRVPMWVRVPERIARENAGWMTSLDAWATRNVQNADLMATLRDVLALEAHPSLTAPALPGRSLVAPPAGDDVTAGQSTCAFRVWHGDGLYAVHGDTKVVLSNQRSAPEVFDLSVDPCETRNLWGTDEGRQRTTPWLEQLVRAGPERMAACQRAAAGCPFR